VGNNVGDTDGNNVGAVVTHTLFWHVPSRQSISKLHGTAVAVGELEGEVEGGAVGAPVTQTFETQNPSQQSTSNEHV